MDQAERLRKLVNNNSDSTIVKPRSARVITITSGKGGVGKTNVTVNLGIQFRKMGKRVIILDADFGLANIEVLFGIIPKYNLADVIHQRKIITEILTLGPMGIQFVSGGSGVQDLVHLSEKQLAYFIKNLYLLDKMADVILIDTGAGVSDSVLSFVSAADEIILVTTPEPTSITDAYALIKTLKSQRESDLEELKIKLLVNRVENDTEGYEIYTKLFKAADKFLDIHLENIGYVPDDRNIVKAVKMQEPVSMSFPKSNAAKAFEQISQDLMNIPSQEENGKSSGIASFMNKLVNIFGGTAKGR